MALVILLAFYVGTEWGWARRGRRGSSRDQALSAVLPPRSPFTAKIRPLAAEFEAQSAIILNASLLLNDCPDVFEQMAAAITENVHLICLVCDDRQRSIARASLDKLSLDSNDVTLLLYPLNTSWIRDYGPIFLRREDGSVSVADLKYNIDAETPGRETRWLDDKIPEVFGGIFNAPVQDVPLFLDGGNLLTNGEGFCLSTDIGKLSTRDYIENRPIVGDEEVRAVGKALNKHLGAKTWLPLPILPEEITGHVDMFATFTGPDSVVVAQCDPVANPADAAILDECAALLARQTTSLGRMRVTRVPMPPRVKNGVYRTYTNVLYANGTRCLFPLSAMSIRPPSAM